jgi:hypothetical protein
MKVRTLLVGACAFTAVGAASAASASVLNITGAGIYSTNQLNVNGVNEYATALDLTVQGSSDPLFVFCVDLNHEIEVNIGSQLTYSPPLTYMTGPVNTNSNGPASGQGDPLTQTVSGEIQTLAEIGVGIAKGAGAPTSWSAATNDSLTAIQGAIWEVEYGFTPSQVTGTSAQNTLIADDVSLAESHPAAGFADGVYSTGPGGSGFGASQGFATGVPEPGVWAMMLVGFGGLGAAMRSRRKQAAATA